jgi:hypothetical protein
MRFTLGLAPMAPGLACAGFGVPDRLIFILL